MPRSGPTSLALPPFAGATRRLIFANLIAFFGFALLGWVAPRPIGLLLGHLALVPAAVFRGEVWQLLTYGFLPMGILGTLFAMLTLWFIGAYLEDLRGSRWLMELYLFSTAAGALLASLLTLVHLVGLRPDLIALGAWSPIFALMVAFSVIAGDQEILFFFFVRMKAKYLVWIYIVLCVAILLKGDDRFGALTELSGALMGYVYTKFAPRRGMALGLSERYFGVRNDYYRWKRRRAAKKFQVYMRKQNREVHFDKDGRYVDPDELRKDPNDKRWMN
ncbi:MAG TPA: rhomboid family intramembrane serine protease [Edaphobacter sp.]|uniref:rhomboid family intramembrane serine protease n=1 Tax=Edaphobacter sp. TaxID=1934404 RepID=UPI002BA6E3B7|nr:rhomboid family intramembrane serine protease [Edaphobacter sp.]HUZ97712.1 rhomboid family intramembrane serine protease [Edaphobacter sp.]